MKDRLPWKDLTTRLIDLMFYSTILLLWAQLLLHIPFLNLKLVGIFTVLITLFNNHRQTNFYNHQSNPNENSYISGGIEATPVHQIAKIRYQLSKCNLLFGFIGAVASSWSFINNT